MNAYRKNALPCFRFHRLAGFPGIVHAVFTRIGGHSPPPWDSLNVGFNGADEAANVKINRGLAADAMGAGGPVLFARQVHGADVLCFKKNDMETKTPKPSPNTAGDAMITDIPGLPIGIQLADCQAVMLYDPLKAVVANVHSGWRGSIQNIVGAAVRRMETDFACEAENIHAAVSPSLGPCCSEFKNYRSELPKEFLDYKDGRDHFNFWAATRDQLAAAGVSPGHMEFAEICTKCNEHLFFSYRKKRETGRFAAVISLNPIDDSSKN